MTRMVHCLKLNKEAEGLDFAPLPGPLGQKVYEAAQAAQQANAQQGPTQDNSTSSSSAGDDAVDADYEEVK